jgi:tyrosyl-tRNA synthetase
VKVKSLLLKCGLVSSHSEAKRLAKQNAVRIDGEIIRNVNREVEIQIGETRYDIKVG